MALLHRVALVGHTHLGVSVCPRVGKRVPDDAVHTLEGVDLFLNGDLIGCVGLEAAADAHVHTFGVLAEHHEVDVLAAAIFQRAQGVIQQLDGAVVGVEVEFKPGAEQDVARVFVVWYPGVAKGSEKNCVIVVAQHVVAVGRQRDTCREIVVRAPRQCVELQWSPRHVANCLKDFHRFCSDVLADSVSWDDCDSHNPVSITVSSPATTSSTRQTRSVPRRGGPRRHPRVRSPQAWPLAHPGRHQQTGAGCGYHPASHVPHPQTRHRKIADRTVPSLGANIP